MADTATLDSVECRVVLIDAESRAVWALNASGGYRLIRASIPQWARPARHLQEAIRARWGLDVLILDLLVKREDNSLPCAVAELLSPLPNSEFARVELNQLLYTELSPRECAIIEFVLRDTVKVPFSRIGWAEEAASWVEDVTDRRVSSKHNIEQWNAGGAFALLHFRTDDDRHYWLKATGEPNRHELPITSFLSKLCGKYLPDFLASKPEWNAWLMSGSASAISGLPTDPSELLRLLGDAVESMAGLQLMTVCKESELLEAGAFDQRFGALLAHSEMFFAYLEEAMALQTSTKAPRIEGERIQELRRISHEICERMAALDIPDTVVHGDLSLGNILVGTGHCQFIDWCEAYVGNPLITVQHLLLLNQASDPQHKKFVDDALKRKYRTLMLRICEPTAIDQGMVFMPFIAAASALYGRVDWLTTSLRSDPRRQAYARTLARHMDRAARDPVLQDLLAA